MFKKTQAINRNWLTISTNDYPIQEKFKNGGFYAVHKNADKQNATEYYDNVATAKALAEIKGKTVFVREHSHLKGVKNPEFEINGLLSDRKQPSFETTKENNAYKTVVNPISQNTFAAQKQGSESVVISLFKRYTIDEIVKGVNYGFKEAIKIKEIIINFRNETFAIITRKHFADGAVKKILEEDYLEPLE